MAGRSYAMKTPSHLQYILPVLLFLLIVPAGCNQPVVPIKIGLSINLSGRGGEAGEHIRDGALLAIEKINTFGGINGRPLKLLIRDDQNSDTGIQTADQSLIDEGVVAIIGHSLSSNTIKAYPFVTSNDTLLITAYSASTQLSGKDDLFLRTGVDCSLFGRKMAALLKKKKARSAAFLKDMANTAFVQDYANNVKKHFDGAVTEVEFNSKKPADWDRIITEMLEPQPDAVIFLTEASMTSVALQKIEAAGYTGNRIGTIWTQTPGLLRHAGASANGLSIITFIGPDNTRPEYLEFAREMEKKFHKKASARSTRAYELVMILADALERCRNIDSRELKAALLAGEYNTLMGHVKFDQFGDVIRPVYEVVVHDNQFRNMGEI